MLQDFFDQSRLTGDFAYYQSKCNGNLPLIASKISLDFHELWWKDDHYKKHREKYRETAKIGVHVPFKIELSLFIDRIQERLKQYDDEIKALKRSVIDGIITTNWDTFLENELADFKIYIGQQELIFSEVLSVGEIYKIHGCVTRHPSLVVTEEDYIDFNGKNAYLAAKLLTIFVEHPIIFMGYSLSDQNIQQIIDSIVKCVDASNLHKLKDRLLFVDWKDGATFDMKDSSIKLPDNKVLPIKLITTESFLPIFETLAALKRQIPVRILRKLKESVFEFVKTSSPKSKIFVQDFDNIHDDSEIEYAIGVGVASANLATHGYKAIEVKDILEDILTDNKQYDAKLLVENTFPKMVKGKAYIPTYKYLRKLNLLNDQGNLNRAGQSMLKDKFTLRLNPPVCFLHPKNNLSKQTEIRRNHKDVNSIINAFDAEHALYYIPMLDVETLDLGQLVKFLRTQISNQVISKSTQFKKMVCLYDYLKYGKL